MITQTLSSLRRAIVSARSTLANTLPEADPSLPDPNLHRVIHGTLSAIPGTASLSQQRLFPAETDSSLPDPNIHRAINGTLSNTVPLAQQKFSSRKILRDKELQSSPHNTTIPDPKLHAMITQTLSSLRRAIVSARSTLANTLPEADPSLPDPNLHRVIHGTLSAISGTALLASQKLFSLSNPRIIKELESDKVASSDPQRPVFKEILSALQRAVKSTQSIFTREERLSIDSQTDPEFQREWKSIIKSLGLCSSVGAGLLCYHAWRAQPVSAYARAHLETETKQDISISTTDSNPAMLEKVHGPHSGKNTRKDFDSSPDPLSELSIKNELGGSDNRANHRCRNKSRYVETSASSIESEGTVLDNDVDNVVDKINHLRLENKKKLDLGQGTQVEPMKLCSSSSGAQGRQSDRCKPLELQGEERGHALVNNQPTEPPLHGFDDAFGYVFDKIQNVKKEIEGDSLRPTSDDLGTRKLREYVRKMRQTNRRYRKEENENPINRPAVIIERSQVDDEMSESVWK